MDRLVTLSIEDSEKTFYQEKISILVGRSGMRNYNLLYTNGDTKRLHSLVGSKEFKKALDSLTNLIQTHTPLEEGQVSAAETSECEVCQ